MLDQREKVTFIRTDWDDGHSFFKDKNGAKLRYNGQFKNVKTGEEALARIGLYNNIESVQFLNI